MWNYSSRIFTCGILLLFGAGLSRQNEQETETIPNQFFDESQFITYDISLAGSPPMLKLLAENEEIIYNLIKNFYLRYGFQEDHLRLPSEEPFKRMHSYLLNFEMTTGQLSLKLENQKEYQNYRAYKVAWNPLTTYFMFQRFLKSLKEIVRNLDTTTEAQFGLQKQIFNIMISTGWPREEDLTSIISSILRIQHVYDLNTWQLSIGNISGYETNVVLSAVDCQTLGLQAMTEGYHALAVEWFEIGKYKFQYYPALATAELSGMTYMIWLEFYVNISHERHDSEWNASEPWDPVFFTLPLKNETSRIRKRTAELEKWKGGKGSNVAEINFWGTCSGANYKDEWEKAKLFCWYETESNYYFKINPLKAELLSIEPLLVIQYYEMIGDNLIEKIKQDATDRLSRSTVVGENYSSVLSSARTSLNTWIDDNQLEEFNLIPKTIEAVTGLKVNSQSSSEMLQVAAYTTGSHYSSHQDALSDQGHNSMYGLTGDRIATFIFYLTDVEKGGGTSFPQSGIASKPVKGSAVLWFNLLRNGEIDEYTYHGACPVIIGEKWISNKWIRSSDQMFLTDYQCVPEVNSRYQPRINGKDLEEFL